MQLAELHQPLKVREIISGPIIEYDLAGFGQMLNVALENHGPGSKSFGSFRAATRNARGLSCSMKRCIAPFLQNMSRPLPRFDFCIRVGARNSNKSKSFLVPASQAKIGESIGLSTKNLRRTIREFIHQGMIAADEI